MKQPALVYRTISPAALTWWRDAIARDQAVADRRKEYCAALLAEFGPVGKRYQYDSEEIDERPLMRDDRNKVTGVLSASGEQPPGGTGWRLDAHTGFWKPDLRTKAGKARAAELEALAGIDLRAEAEQHIGLPSMFFGTGMMYRPALTFDPDEQAIYTRWPAAECRAAMPADLTASTGVVWEEVPLSVWHAAQEVRVAEADQEGSTL
ncbi:hypothetical protein ACXR2T_07880 [Leucobacter sp. HY1910]